MPAPRGEGIASGDVSSRWLTITDKLNALYTCSYFASSCHDGDSAFLSLLDKAPLSNSFTSFSEGEANITKRFARFNLVCSTSNKKKTRLDDQTMPLQSTNSL